MPRIEADKSPEWITDPLQLIAVDDVAATLAVSTKTVRRMIARGNLLSFRVGRLVRVRRSDLEQYIASCG